MRPVLLDLHGFASFREPTRVDFADAEFFALVGPTGSGKSTVIDAMTFALYGSVPRWGRKNMVSLALSPTVARGTVKLVFDVSGQRYVVARELRRMGSQGSQVNQRAASLERLADPAGLAASGEETVPLAKDLAGVNEAVERLLGLSYEDFIQCVVLPQGQFADFLHAKPAERQEILLRLLGAEHYKQMMVKANQRSAAAAQRAEAVAETLRGYADATPEAAAAAAESAAALARLGTRVTDALPRITEAESELAAAQEKLRRLRAEQSTLSALRVPDGVATLDADLAVSEQARAGLRAAEQAAEQTDTAARAELADAPRRAPLELAREHRAERGRHQAAIPELVAGVTRLGERAAQVSAAADTAAAVLDAARAERDAALAAATVAGERVTGLAAAHARLAAVSVPAGVTELDQRRAAAAAAVTAAAAALEAAERADAAAREARTAAAPDAPLAQANRDLGDLRTLLADTATARAAAQRAATGRQAAETALAAAQRTRADRQASLEAARRDHVVAGLRPHLVAGEPCPVCEQPVAALPAPLPAREVEAAQARLGEAEHAVTAAQSAARAADAAAATADADLSAITRRRTALASDLAGLLSGPLAGFPLPAARAAQDASRTAGGGAAARGDATAGATETGRDPGEDERLARALQELSVLARARRDAERAAEQADAAAQQARARHRAAQDQAARTEHELTAAAAALRTARDPLVELGAPPLDGTSLAGGWTALARWAGEQARERSAALDQAREAETAAGRRRAKAATEFADADRAVTRLRTEARAASGDDQQARARLSQVTARVSELDDLLAGAPDDAQITERLARLTRLETAAADAERALRDARAARAAGESAHGQLERAAGTARTALSAARDRVVALGAPALDGQGLLVAWTALVSWAASQAAARLADIGQADAATAAASASAAKLAGELSADLAGAGITLAPDRVTAGAAAAVATAAERARAVIGRIEERRGEAAGLLARQQAAAADEQVAKLLGDLLRANQFQRWLVAEALDDLVTEASATLAALSSGQFDLVYDDGDFYVVDHTDADARRSVRTLSGGETFQASLALALALSSQISSLAAAGAARLDSIFLDEGFGTLDPETLEVVATTLEALAEGDRMVGVVTHVAALAERVPVRFRVSRNARTSTVTREGLLTETEES
jgi:exonuclease SbcC